MPRIDRVRVDYMPGPAAVEALQTAQGLFPNSNTQALIDRRLSRACLRWYMGIGSRRRCMDATAMRGSCPATCAPGRESLLKETPAKATGSGRTALKYREVRNQSRKHQAPAVGLFCCWCGWMAYLCDSHR